MDVLTLERNAGACLRAACAVLARGGIVVYPTETAYGIGADATNPTAVARVFAIKGRDDGKPLSVLMASQGMAREYAILTPVARRLWRRFLPGPLTLVIPARSVGGTWGIRVSSHPFAAALVRAYGRPITATSANRSGMPPLYDSGAIIRAFGRRRIQPDLLIDAGVLPHRTPSTVVSCTPTDIAVLRIGAIPKSDIFRAL
jgi:L-threonylcarbamoyladenylate synthase